MKFNISDLSINQKEEFDSLVNEKNKYISVFRVGSKLYFKFTESKVKIEVQNDEILKLLRLSGKSSLFFKINKDFLTLISYVPLHVTSSYTRGESLLNVNDIADDNFLAVALVDNCMFGQWDFFKSCRDKGITPILGYRINVRLVEKKSIYQFVLIAKNYQGYINICRLIDLDLKYYKLEQLKAYSEGIIALSGGINSELFYLYHNHKSSPNLKYLMHFLIDIFKDDFYMEINKNMPEDLFQMIDFFNSNGIKTIATDEAIYKKYSVANEGTMSVMKKCLKTDLKNLHGDFHMHTMEEMEEIFDPISLSMQNTLEVYEKCRDFRFEEIPLLYNSKKYKEIINLAYSEGEIKCVNSDWKSRLDYEINSIANLNFQPFIIMLYEIVQFCLDNNILFQIRGSSYSSLLFYLLGITQFNPINYGLLTERFMNSKRKKKMDIDFEIQQDKRELLIEFLMSNYPNFNFLKLAKVTSFTLKTISTSLQNCFGIKFNSDDVPKNFEIARDKIIGHPNIFSSHGSAIAIVDKNQHFPTIVTNKNKPSVAKVVQITSSASDNFNFLKLDLLSSVYLKGINETLTELGIKIKDIPLEIKPFSLLVNKMVVGVFQLSDFGNLPFLANAFSDLLTEDKKPKNDVTFDDFFRRLIVIISLNRPSTVRYQKKFIECLSNKCVFDTGDEFEVLNESNGFLIFQEQLMIILHRLTNLPLDDCDGLRKQFDNPNMSINEFEKIKNDIINLADNICKKEKAMLFFDEFFKYEMKDFFYNKSHAVSYGYLCYISLYLISKNNIVYYKNLLNSTDPKEIGFIINKLRNYGLKFGIPDIKNPNLNFTVMNDEIIFGLNNLGSEKFETLPVYKDTLEEYLFENNMNYDLFLALATIGYFNIYGYNPYELINEKEINIITLIQCSIEKLNPKLNILKEKIPVSINTIEQIKRTTLKFTEINEDALSGFILPGELSENIGEYCSTLESYEEGYYESLKTVYSVGKVTNLNKKIQRNSEYMLTFNLVFGSGRIKSIIFGSNISIAKDLNEGSLILATGIAQDNGYGPTFIINSLLTVDEFHPEVKTIVLSRDIVPLINIFKEYISDVEEENKISVICENEEKMRIKYSYSLEMSIRRYRSVIKMF